jgi:predicted ATPase
MRRSGLGKEGFVRGVRLMRDEVPGFDEYPFAIPAIRELDELHLDPKVTFFVGENGSGKSTLLEAIAIAAGFNAEGGTKNYRFAERPSESTLAKHLRLVRGARRETSGFFLRAESLFNAATYRDQVGANPLGQRSLHDQSHGEAFLALARDFRGHGLYLMDEPEAALSPARQLALVKIIHTLVERSRSQFVIATHSPILLAYPGALLYHFGDGALREIAYRDTEHFLITRDFLSAPDVFLDRLLVDED